MRHALRFAPLVLAVLAVFPAAASASHVEAFSVRTGTDPGYVTFSGAGVERNDVRLSGSPLDDEVVLVTDLSSPLSTGPGCSPIDTHHARCVAAGAGPAVAVARLGYGDDRLITKVRDTAVDAGYGDDRITTAGGSRVLGGAGDDRLVGKAGDALGGGGGDDALRGGSREVCGPGTDYAEPTRATFVTRDCERLNAFSPLYFSLVRRAERGLAVTLTLGRYPNFTGYCATMWVRRAGGPVLATLRSPFVLGRSVTRRLALTRAGRRALSLGKALRLVVAYRARSCHHPADVGPRMLQQSLPAR